MVNAKEYRQQRDDALKLLDECTMEKHGLEDSILYLKKQREEKKKEKVWVLDIKAQTFTLKDLHVAQEKMKVLMDLGLGYVELREKNSLRI